jgi:hypothetical protein
MEEYESDVSNEYEDEVTEEDEANQSGESSDDE